MKKEKTVKKIKTARKPRRAKRAPKLFAVQSPFGTYETFESVEAVAAKHADGTPIYSVVVKHLGEVRKVSSVTIEKSRRGRKPRAEKTAAPVIGKRVKKVVDKKADDLLG